MSFSIGPFASLPQPVAAHDTEFKCSPVRRYADDAVLGLGATAGGQADGNVTQEAVDSGALSALPGLAPLRPAEFVIVRFGQKLGPDEAPSG